MIQLLKSFLCEKHEAVATLCVCFFPRLSFLCHLSRCFMKSSFFTGKGSPLTPWSHLGEYGGNVHIILDVSAHYRMMWSASRQGAFPSQLQKRPGTNFCSGASLAGSVLQTFTCTKTQTFTSPVDLHLLFLASSFVGFLLCACEHKESKASPSVFRTVMESVGNITYKNSYIFCFMLISFVFSNHIVVHRSVFFPLSLKKTKFHTSCIFFN